MKRKAITRRLRTGGGFAIRSERCRDRPSADLAFVESQGEGVADREKESVGDALRKHVKALTLDIGPRTPFMGDSVARTAVYIQSVFEDGGLSNSTSSFDAPTRSRRVPGNQGSLASR